MRKILLILLAIFAAAGVVAQDGNGTLEAMQKVFEGAALETKIEMLKSTEEEGPEKFGPLYVDAVWYIVNNGDDLPINTDLRELSLLAIKYLEMSGYEAGIVPLWRLFEADEDINRRIAILNVYKNTAPRDSEIVQVVADWVQAQNNLKRSEEQVEVQTIQAAVQMLVEMKSPVAFDVLVDSMNVQYSEAVTTIARNGLVQIEGGLDSLAIEAVRRAGVLDKVEIQNLFLDSDEVEVEVKTAIAVGVLAQMLQLVSPDVIERQKIREMRYKAAGFLVGNPDTTITSLAIRHFNQTVREYESQEVAPKSAVLEAIALLGQMGTLDAANRLGEFLNLLNSYTEKTTPYDDQIVLAVIKNLEILGKKEVHDILLYTTFLNYSNTVKNAARQAMRTISQ